MKTGIDITIKGVTYELIKDYKDLPHYRQSLNRLTKQSFGLDFEQWYQQGYWKDKYRPYSLLHNNEIVANISANPIDYLADGILYPTVQIGTVMTDQVYRNQGLSKELMNIVLQEYENSCDMFYLYANDSVLDFYPRYGFTKAEEYVYTKLFREQGNKLTYRRLDLQLEKDKSLLIRLVINTKPISRYSMIGNPELMMFHLTSYMAGNILYFEELDLAAVVTWEEDSIWISDLFCEHEFAMESVVNSLVNRSQSKVILGFTPHDNLGFTAEILKEEGSTFFIKGKNFLDKGRFPALSHA